MTAAPDDKIVEALAKTGFVLEHEVVTALQRGGWLTINGSYYIDDVSEQARELDIIAYKIARHDDIDVLTCGLISCKKDASYTAAFLSRKRPRRDPNADWEPLHQVSRVEPMRAHLSSSDWKKRYFSSAKRRVKRILVADRDIFAFQMVCKEGKPHNDKPYYESVTGLLKALDHEINKRQDSKAPARKRLYQFSLHTVIDAPMVDVQFQDEEQKVRPVDEITGFSRFMVRKKDTAASIHFTSQVSLPRWIADLDALHRHNSQFFSEEVDRSFKAILTSKEVRKHFEDRLDFWLTYKINRAITRLKLGKKIEKIHLDVESETLLIEIDKDSGIDDLNADAELKREVSDALIERARYSGPFRIAEYADIPF
ncbi:hypothetical protein [Stenotrophomonas muris]|uniref:hypothetical protein n=1 Tax=Stenotrophomonas muris TaxID=2963283 RepID=UPI002E763338|nr:hypothetical protein [Stenotrophomonas muris]